MIKIFNKILPSSKLKNDIHIQYNKIDSMKPISLLGMSLISPIRKQILKKRKSHITIEKSNKKLSLIVPYRHREEHLEKFIPYMKNYLTKQNINYEIIIVEQADTQPFNRAKLMNIGVLNAAKDSEYFIFHDVDLLPINIDYSYCNHTKKLFAFIDDKQFGETIFGGATLVPKEIFYDINGFSNNYWQWGKEDDDFLFRHLLKGYIPLFDSKGKFRSLPHEDSMTRDNNGNYSDNKNVLTKNKNLYKANKKYFSNFKRGFLKQNDDGISSVNNYTIKGIKENNRYKTVYVLLK